jgi:outer membrane translocation and assembly module TamA
LFYGVSADLAGLDNTTNPSFGAHYRAEWRHADGIRDIDPSFEQWLLEARTYLPVFAKRRVLAFRGVYTGIEPVGGATVLPFYRLPLSDGALRFAGYSAERFRDRQLVLGRAEYRWAIFYQLQALGFYELGEVAPRSSSFTWTDTHESVGGGLRFAFHDDSVVRAELARSTEGFRAVLTVGGDF